MNLILVAIVTVFFLQCCLAVGILIYQEILEWKVRKSLRELSEISVRIRTKICELNTPKESETKDEKLFNWERDYGPLWHPGSKAFWLEPEPNEITPGVWPMPFISLHVRSQSVEPIKGQHGVYLYGQHGTKVVALGAGTARYMLNSASGHVDDTAFGHQAWHTLEQD